MDAMDGFAQHAGHGEHAQFVPDGVQSIVDWNCVCHCDTGDFRRGEPLDGLANHDGVGARQMNACCAALTSDFGGFHHGASRGDHVVEHDHGATLHFANDIFHFHFAAALAALLNNGQVNSGKERERMICGSVRTRVI